MKKLMEQQLEGSLEDLLFPITTCYYSIVLSVSSFTNNDNTTASLGKGSLAFLAHWPFFHYTNNY